MNYRVAINGYGRIGQSLLRSAYKRKGLPFQIALINELAEPQTIAYLTRYDSTHGRFEFDVKLQSSESLLIGGVQTIALTRQENISAMDWCAQGIDLVFDCTGAYGSRRELAKHIQAGASKVIVSQPGDGSLDKTIVYGINHHTIDSHDQIISAASCTSNAVLPVLKCLHQAFGIESGSLTTIHSAMNDQPVIDAYHHCDLRRTRSAMINMVPVDTGLVKGIERIEPDLAGKLSATAMRVPTVNVSALDVCLYLKKSVDVHAINSVLKNTAAQDEYGIMCYVEEPLASCDFIQDACSCNIDGTQTRVSGGHFVKVLIWFDNEWAFANRMLDIASYWLNNAASDSVKCQS